MARQIKKATKTPTQAKPQPKVQIQASDAVFALDIGTRSIIGMVGIVEENKVKIIAIEREEHPERAMIDGQIENIEKVSALAGKVKKRLEDKVRFKLTRVCVAAAGRALRSKRAEFELELPGTQLIDEEIISRLEAGAITKAEEAFDAENEAAEDHRRFYLVGYTVCQYFLDQYMISNLKDHRGRHIKVDLIATFLPSEVVESLYTTMNKIGLEVASLTLEPIAAINAAIPENIRLLNLVLVDIGAGTSDIAACTGGSVTGYTMATVAGDEITETIMKEYLVDFATAEFIKAQLDKSQEIIFSDIMGLEHKVSKDEILQCIQGTSGFLCKEIADKVVDINGGSPSALFLAGGGSKLAGVKEGITTALGMDANRVAVAGNYFQSNAFSDEYDLNNPEYATPLGIVISSGLNMINDSFRVILNGKPAKLFRSGSFTALNLLMMNGYNFRDILGRPGLNLTVTVNGRRKVFYGTSSEPATLLINQKEGKLSEVIHAGDCIDFVPAVQGIPAKAFLGDIEGADTCLDITLNGIHASLKTPLKTGDIINIRLPKMKEAVKDEQDKNSMAVDPETKEGVSETEFSQSAQPPQTVSVRPAEADQKNTAPPDYERTDRPWEEEIPTRGFIEHPQTESSQEISMTSPFQEEILETELLEQEPSKDDISPSNLNEADAYITPDVSEESGFEGSSSASEEQETDISLVPSGEPEPDDALISSEKADSETPKAETISFLLNGVPLDLPKKEEGRPYYLMDLIQYSGINLERPRGVVKLMVNGIPGMFQQALSEGDEIRIEEDRR